MSKIDPKVKEIIAKYHDNPEEAVWLHKQSGQWLAKHKALEVIAAKANIIFDAPTVLEFDLEKKVAAFIVTGRMDNRLEWSVGEATSYNSQNNYYGSMAEKRGKDRVILKLIGLHGEVYSDQEIDTPDNGNVLDSKTRNDANDQFILQVNLKLDEVGSLAELESCLTETEKDFIKKKLSKSNPVAYGNFMKRYKELQSNFKEMEAE